MDMNVWKQQQLHVFLQKKNSGGFQLSVRSEEKIK
jgi:hypothetical protein